MTAPAPKAAVEAETHVVIDPALRALYRAARRGTPAAPPAETRPPDRPAPAREMAPLRWQRIRLRRDGARPLVFEGLGLLSRRVETPLTPDGPCLEQLFELYLARHGDLVARLALLVPDGAPARPVHSVLRLGPGTTRETLVAAHDPARGLPARDDTAAPDRGAAARLRAACGDLVAIALGAAPAPAIPCHGD